LRYDPKKKKKRKTVRTMSTWCPGHSLRGECEIGKKLKNVESRRKNLPLPCTK
jgi:hypothetical protein